MTTTDDLPPAVLPDAPAPTGPRESRGSSLRHASNVFAPVAFAGVMIAYCVWLGGAFTDLNARLLDVHQNTPIMLTALGLCICLVAGQFDLSVGSVVTLSCYFAVGLTSHQGVPFNVALVLCVLMGVAVGLVNALFVLGLKVNAFIATLASGGVVAGIAAVYAGGSPLTPTAEDKVQIGSWFSGSGSFGTFQSKAPDLFLWLVILVAVTSLAQALLESLPLDRVSRARMIVYPGGVLVWLVLGWVCHVRDVRISWPILLLLTVTIVLWLVCRYTSFGRCLYAVGGNADAARLAGVRVTFTSTIAFVISSTLAAVAGIVLAANQGSASPDIGAPYLLPAFAAAFLSTVLFSSGKFHVWGTVFGAYILVEVGQGLIVGGLHFTWTGVVNGAVLAFAVSLATVLRRYA